MSESETERQVRVNRELVEQETKRLADQAAQRQREQAQRDHDNSWR